MTAQANPRRSRLLRGQDRIAYSVAQAAEATGYSEDVIRRAIRAGDLTPVAGTIAGRPVAKTVIRHTDLEAWLIEHHDVD